MKEKTILALCTNSAVAIGTFSLGIGLGMLGKFLLDKLHKTESPIFAGEDRIIAAAKRL